MHPREPSLPRARASARLALCSRTAEALLELAPEPYPPRPGRPGALPRGMRPAIEASAETSSASPISDRTDSRSTTAPSLNVGTRPPGQEAAGCWPGPHQPLPAWPQRRACRPPPCLSQAASPSLREEPARSDASRQCPPSASSTTCQGDARAPPAARPSPPGASTRLRLLVASRQELVNRGLRVLATEESSRRGSPGLSRRRHPALSSWPARNCLKSGWKEHTPVARPSSRNTPSLRAQASNPSPPPSEDIEPAICRSNSSTTDSRTMPSSTLSGKAAASSSAKNWYTAPGRIRNEVRSSHPAHPPRREDPQSRTRRRASLPSGHTAV